MQGTESEAAELLAEDRCEGMEYEDFCTDLNEAIQDALTGAVQEVAWLYLYQLPPPVLACCKHANQQDCKKAPVNVDCCLSHR